VTPSGGRSVPRCTRWTATTGVSRLGLVLAVAAVLAGCGGTPPQEIVPMSKPLRDVSDADLRRLGGKKILFGHQSVGRNILDGIRDLEAGDPRFPLRIVEMPSPPALAPGCLTDVPIGKNGDPLLKTDHFAQLLRDGLGATVDIAFHKYCYVDFRRGGPGVAEVFEHYRATMSALEREFPRVTLVHVTVPLVSARPSVLERIGRIFGALPREEALNVLRDEFNALLRAEYGGKEPIFDLARVESTRPDGRRETFRWRGADYDTLVPEYTSDGGHLNEDGRRRAAESLLVLLASLPDRR
jgi:hypothetical protein